ncbi:MAG TPA: extracellular solute-binding protein [Thermomicrobiales bacterium]|nr:extracellular solute-binding protein [Thermomicrobiales bacterium]
MSSSVRRTSAISRRTFGKAALGAAGAAVVTSSPTYAAPYLNFNRQAGELNVMYLYVPFMESIIPKFEEETGIAVNTVSTYQSNDEWWAKINAGERADFLIASTDWVQRAMAADLLGPIDTSKLSNLETLQEEFQANEVYIADGESHAIPWTRVYYSLIYNTNEFSEAPTSWDVTWNEAYSGRISVMDQAFARVATTALYLGQDPLNPDDPDAIREALIEQKPLITKYWQDFQNGMEIFMNEEAVVGQLTAGRTRMAISQDAPVSWTVPEEGCVTFIDTFIIPKDAENVDEAHQLIDFLIRPDIMVEEMTMMYYDTLSAEAHDQLPEDIRPWFELPEDANLVLSVDLPSEVRQMMDQMWEEVKLS